MKNKFYLLLLIIIGFIGIKSLFHSGFYTSHDGRHQIVRLVHFHQGLIDGQFPVRWAGTAFKGFGYPLFIFTYRLPFWIAEFWYLISKNLVNSIKFTFIISYLFSGLSMFFFAKELWRSKWAGFVSAVLYLWAPYRFVNIFIRAALGEAVTFTFLPTLFLGILFIAKKRFNLGMLLSSLSLTALILSHAMTLILWTIPITTWIIFNFFQAFNKKNYLIEIFLSFLWSAFITAFYWLPANIEKKYTIFASSIGDYYKDHFIALKQLIYSKWGYGFSMAGTENDGMSFQIGIAHWLVIIIISGYFLTLFIIKNKKLRRLFSKVEQKTIFNRLFFLLIFFFSIYLILPYSEWFYHRLKEIMVIDFPWRYLGVSVFAAGILGGSLVIIFKDRIFRFLIGISIIGLCLYSNRNHLRVNQYTYYPDQEYWQDQETTNEHNDYAPKWFLDQHTEDSQFQIKTLEGNSNNKLVSRKSNLLRFYSEVKTQKAVIMTRLAYYPGWQILIDGQQGKITHKDGKIKVELAKGNHLITLIFKETQLRLFCDWLSLISFLFFIGYFIKYARKIR